MFISLGFESGSGSLFIPTEDCPGGQLTGLGRGTKLLSCSVYGPDISEESVGTQTTGQQDEGADI